MKIDMLHGTFVRLGDAWVEEEVQETLLSLYHAWLSTHEWVFDALIRTLMRQHQQYQVCCRTCGAFHVYCRPDTDGVPLFTCPNGHSHRRERTLMLCTRDTPKI